MKCTLSNVCCGRTLIYLLCTQPALYITYIVNEIWQGDPFHSFFTQSAKHADPRRAPTSDPCIHYHKAAKPSLYIMVCEQYAMPSAEITDRMPVHVHDPNGPARSAKVSFGYKITLPTLAFPSTHILSLLVHGCTPSSSCY